MTRMVIISLALLLSFSNSSCDSTQADKAADETQKESKKGKKKKSKLTEAASAEVKVLQKWELPPFLREISGIAFLGNNRFACIQDESGVIFLYNTRTSQIEKQVQFGAAGDYEAIAVVGKTAYVARSDGKLFEVDIVNNQAQKVKEYSTSLTAKNDIEGLAYDQKNNRLLLAIKGTETGNKDYKGIYAFNLATKKFVADPVFKIDLTDSIFANNQTKKLSQVVQPSEIAINPVNGNIYITDAANSQLLIMDPAGALKTRYKLNKVDFSHPEGIAFSPTGELYISNEGAKGNGNILQVRIGDQ